MPRAGWILQINWLLDTYSLNAKLRTAAYNLLPTGIPDLRLALSDSLTRNIPSGSPIWLPFPVQHPTLIEQGKTIALACATSTGFHAQYSGTIANYTRDTLGSWLDNDWPPNPYPTPGIAAAWHIAAYALFEQAFPHSRNRPSRASRIADWPKANAELLTIRHSRLP
jgi:hypothetical protein